MSGASSLFSQLGGLASIAGVNLSAGGEGRVFQAVLNSRRLVEQFIQRGNLLEEFAPDTGEPPTLWGAVERFRGTVLKVREDPTEGITTVIVDWTDPVVAARWANEFVGLANELIRAEALEEAGRNIEFLNKQIERTNIVEVQRVMYNLIESETKALMLAHVRSEYAFRIVDPAVAPEMRLKPRRKVIVLSGGALGLFAGMLVAFALNLFRRMKREG